MAVAIHHNHAFINWKGCAPTNKSFTLVTLSVGVTLAIAGIFLLLAASDILPNGVNVISDLGLDGKIISGVILGFGLLSLGSGIMQYFFKREALRASQMDHRHAPSALVEPLTEIKPTVNNPNQRTHQPSDPHERIATHFDIDIDLVREVMLDQNYHSTAEAVGRLPLPAEKDKTVKIEKTAWDDLESIFKDKLKEKHKITDSHTSIAYSDWEEIPLKNLLILSDGFYDVRPQCDDLVYLTKQLGKDGSRDTPVTRTKYTDEDVTKFNSKIQHLKLTNTSERTAADQMQQLHEQQVESPPPYDSLVNLIEAFLDTPLGNVEPFEELGDAFSETYAHPAIQSLRLPDFGNNPVSEWPLYNADPHKFAVYLWNGLAQVGYALPVPSDLLKEAAFEYETPLLA